MREHETVKPVVNEESKFNVVATIVAGPYRSTADVSYFLVISHISIRKISKKYRFHQYHV